MSDESKDGVATAMLSAEDAARVAESSMQTADYGGDPAAVLADAVAGAAADLIAAETPATASHGSSSRVVAVIGAGGASSVTGATALDLTGAAATEHDDTISDESALNLKIALAAKPTEMEEHPARTDEVDTLDDRAALDAKIRAHLDRDAPLPTVDPMIGSVIAGRFEVVSKLGAGGMGAVYRAKQHGIDRSVAIKVLLQELATNETLIRRFTIEALAVSRLKHPNTIQIFDFGKTAQGNLYIAMELLEGETLYARHVRERRLPVRHALHIVGQVAASLAEAHDKGIIHRDLKPENIFLTRVGDDANFVKVLDFGVAKLRDGDGDGKGTLTQAGSIFGTPRYMSPEQASARPVDARSDVYSLGIILYELVVGHAPFVSDTPLSLLLAHVHDEPEAPSAACPDLGIPLAVEELILSLLEKAPADRVQSASELAQRCARLAAALPEAFDRPVSLDEAQALGVALSAPATVLVPMEGLPSDTMQLGGSPTSVDRPAPPGRRSGLIALTVLLVSCAVGGAVWFQAARRSAPATVVAPSADVAPAAPPSAGAQTDTTEGHAGPATVRVQVITVPPGANVLLVGTPPTLLGSTPLPLERTQGTQLRVRLERDGYETQDLALDFAESTTVKLVLPRQPSADAPDKPVRHRRAVARPRPKPRKPRPNTKAPRARLASPPEKPKKPTPKVPGLVGDLM